MFNPVFFFLHTIATTLAVICIFFDGSIQLSIISGFFFISSYLSFIYTK